MRITMLKLEMQLCGCPAQLWWLEGSGSIPRVGVGSIPATGLQGQRVLGEGGRSSEIGSAIWATFES